MKKHLITTGLSICAFWALAQSSTECSRVLSQAELAFEQGRLSDIITDFNNEDSGLSRCLNQGVFSIDEKIRACKLLTKAYLFQDDEKKAEEMFIELLKIDKEHQLSTEDPAELYLLKDKFKTEPILRVTVRTGLNKTFPEVINNFNTFQSDDKKYNEKGDETGLGINYWVEVLAEKHLLKGIEVAAGLQYRATTYEVEGDIIANDLNYLAKNSSKMFRLPILLRYDLSYGKNLNYDKKGGDRNKIGFSPYVFVGGSFDLTLSAKYVDVRRTGGTAYTLPSGSDNLKSENQVSSSNISIMGGLGGRFRIGRTKVNFFSVELRYDNSLLNYINPDNRWANEDMYVGVGHVEDDLTINALSISFGYTRSLYIPRKRKQYR